MTICLVYKPWMDNFGPDSFIFTLGIVWHHSLHLRLMINSPLACAVEGGSKVLLDCTISKLKILTWKKFSLTYFKISLRLVDLNVLEKSQFLTYGISSSHRWGLIPRPVVLDQCCNHVAGMGRLVIAPFGIFHNWYP